MLLIIPAVLLVCLLVLLGVLLAWSPGKPAPFLDENGRPLAGSISEKIRVKINGVDQGMFIKSKDVTHPVLLFLHGGPGMPEYFLNQDYPTGLDEDFTVCWWERRGAGLSYRANIPPETMTVEQMISDIVEVTNTLRLRFSKEKIVLMTHSGGSFFGIQAAARAPELYSAYIGMAQMSYQLKSERLAYEFMDREFKSNGNTRMLRRLEAAPPTMAVPLPDAYMGLRDEAMHVLGIGTMHAMKSVVRGVFLAVWQNREYTLGEKISIWRGKLFSSRCLWNEMIATDLAQQVTEFHLPVYFVSGKYDYTVSYTLAKDYFARLHAPVKGFYTFGQSAHCPLFEEPEKMRRILQEDVLLGTNHLADQT